MFTSFIYDADLSEKDISEEVLKSCYIYTHGKDKNGAHSGNKHIRGINLKTYIEDFTLCLDSFS